MNNIRKRLLLFLLGCIPSRLLLVYVAKNIQIDYLPILGYITLIIAIGFTYIYLTDSRKTGSETFGEKIWWNNLRPIHAMFYYIFSYYAINKIRSGWAYLLYDVIFGLFSFLIFHYINNDFTPFYISNADFYIVQTIMFIYISFFFVLINPTH